MNTFTTNSTPPLGGRSSLDGHSSSSSPSSSEDPTTGRNPNAPLKQELTAWENFAISAIAPSLAVLFTNPFDTVKVRLQLQGEVVKTRIPGSNGKEVVKVSEKVQLTILSHAPYPFYAPCVHCQ